MKVVRYNIGLILQQPLIYSRAGWMKTVLITGTNIGIGLQLTKSYVLNGYRVIATCRNISKELKSSGATIIDGIDLTQTSSAEKLQKNIGNTKIDILINNAGAWCNDSINQMNFEGMIRNFEINTIGTLRVVDALRSNLRNPSKIAIITSKMGSISDNSGGGRYGYRMSKAALNVAGKSLSIDLKPNNISVAMIHPGWVQTDMGGENALISANESVTGTMKVISKMDLTNTGEFHNYDGELISW